MAENEFIKTKLDLMAQDKQAGFNQLAPSLIDMAKTGVQTRTVQIPADGNWFVVSFDAIEERTDRLVISAKRKMDGMLRASHDPSERQYIVEFQGARAAYLRGFYEPNHRRFGWPYISWDVRSYITHPQFPGSRIFVRDFFAHNEIKKMILAMEGFYGTTNIYNSYINDNLARVRNGLKAGKSIDAIEKEWSKGMMESIGYRRAEALQVQGEPDTWSKIMVHWCKHEQDLRG
jgi:hypothetical protein